MKTISKIKTFFPQSKSDWIKYTKTSLPIIFAAMVLSFNSFVDNFMATSIKGGNQALSYSNQWTQYSNGIISATTIVGTAIFAQYYGYGDKRRIREVVRARMLIALSIALLFAIPAIIAPEFLVRIASGFDKDLSWEIINKAIVYMRVISITWILYAWFYTSSMIIREAGYGKTSLYASILSLLLNIVFNSLFTFIFNLGIIGLAISTIISIFIPILFIVFYLYKNARILIINPFKIFMISKEIWTQIIKRIPSFILTTIGSICISTRFIFWNIGYPTGKVGSNIDYALSAANILGISGMFFNIFWTTFESMNANISIYVGRELGNNNYIQAKTNAKQIQGFNLVFATIMGITLFSLSFAIEKMIFLTQGYEQQLDSILNEKYPNNLELIKTIKEKAILEYMTNLKWTIWPLSWNMPMWVWYITKSRIISGGGKTNVVSTVETLNGLFQISWIALINFLIVPKTNLSFPVAYALFFSTDIIKVPIYEMLYYKVNWAKNITLDTSKPENLLEKK